MRFIVAGDVHIGRSSSSLPDLDGVDVSATSAWRRVVNLAIERKVDALLLTGDVIDQADAYYEARATVKRGLDNLHSALPDIRVVAVTGNHDATILPRVVDALQYPKDFFTLLGRDGRWERTELSGTDSAVTIDGWSYPSERPRAHPLPQLDRGQTGKPRLVMVHGDYASSSEYVAVVPAEARSLGGVVDMFLMGHIHYRGDLARDETPLVLYTGSPQALDPGEPGRHGCWELQVERSGTCTRTYHGLSTVRYDTVEVEAADVASLADLERCLDDATDDWSREDPSVAVVVPRLRVMGRHPDPAAVRSWVSEMQEHWRPVQGRGHLERAESTVSPMLDLEAIRESSSGGPHVIAATLLADLRKSDLQQHHELVDLIRQAVRAARGHRDFRDIDEEQADDEDTRIRVHLERVLAHLLDEMIGTRGEPV